MTTFSFRIYAARIYDEGSVAILSFLPLRSGKVECSLDDLPAELVKATTGFRSPHNDYPDLKVISLPVSDAPAGFEDFQNKGLNTLYVCQLDSVTESLPMAEASS